MKTEEPLNIHATQLVQKQNHVQKTYWMKSLYRT